MKYLIAAEETFLRRSQLEKAGVTVTCEVITYVLVFPFVAD